MKAQKRNNRTAVVLTKDEFEALKHCSEQTGYSASYILLTALETALHIGKAYRFAMSKISEAEKTQFYNKIIEALKADPKSLDGFLKVYNHLQLLENLAFFWNESEKIQMSDKLKELEKQRKKSEKALIQAFKSSF